VPEQLYVDGMTVAWRYKTDFKWNLSASGGYYEQTFPIGVTMRVAIATSTDEVRQTITVTNGTRGTLRSVSTNTCLAPEWSPYFTDPTQERTGFFTSRGVTPRLQMDPRREGEFLHCGYPVNREGDADWRTCIEAPIMFIRSVDGNYIIAQASGPASGAGGNAHYSCLHTSPTWPEIPPGESRSIDASFYFMKGGPEELLARWEEDYGVV